MFGACPCEVCRLENLRTTENKIKRRKTDLIYPLNADSEKMKQRKTRMMIHVHVQALGIRIRCKI